MLTVRPCEDLVLRVYGKLDDYALGDCGLGK